MVELCDHPRLKRLLDSEDIWATIEDFDRLMQASEDRLRAIESDSDAAQAARLMHQLAREHYHLLLVGQYKVTEIGQGIKAALENGNEIVLFNLTRAFLEHTAALAYQIKALEKAVSEIPKKTDLKSFRQTVARHQGKANRIYYNKSAEIHVHDMLKELGRHYENVRREYDRLCEFVHPNYGSNQLVSSGNLGSGQIRSHAAELKDELFAVNRIIERCSQLIQDEFNKTASIMLGSKLASWIETAGQDGAKLSQVFSLRGATSGDGQTKKTALFFKKARTQQEAVEAFYEYLHANNIDLLNREPEAVEGGYLYDRVITDRGTLWVKYKMSMLD